MNAAHGSVLHQPRRSRRPAVNSKVTRSRAALSSTATNMPLRTTGQKVEKLNADAWLHSPETFSNKRSEARNGMRSIATLANAGRSERTTAPRSSGSSARLRASMLSGVGDQTLSISQPLTPMWLSSLLFLKRGSDVMTFLLVAATLTIYSWTVYTQQQWSREYRNLETLQRHERQMTTANAAIKNQLAQQAESPSTGLVNPTQANAIFLPPAPQRQSHTAPTKTTDPEPVPKTPLGY